MRKFILPFLFLFFPVFLFAHPRHHWQPQPSPSPITSPSPSKVPSPSPIPSPSPSSSPLPSPIPSPTGIQGHLFFDDFTLPNELVTNEYAYWNPSDPKAVKSANWEMDSGSFFIQGNSGWTGIPDDIAPNATSSNGNNSAVFRLDTKRSDFGNVAVYFNLRNNGFTSTPSTPAVDWDGIHIFLHYQSEYSLYYASVDRRDGTCVIKKKVPGGPSNGGTYYDLSNYFKHTFPIGSYQVVKATIQDNSNGSVTIAIYINGSLIVQATDNGVGGAPITAPGKTGIRGDNCNFNFDNFTVDSL